MVTYKKIIKLEKYIMCNSFFAKNFRTFKEIKIEKLAKVNLFLGGNSVGKTALLEAFYLHLHQNKMEAIESLLVKKDEHLSHEDESSSIGSIVRHLFHKHQLPNFDDEGITLGEINANKLTKVTATINDEDDEVLKVTKNKETEYALLRDDFNELYSYRRMRFMRRAHTIIAEKINLQFVHSSGTDNIVKMWDNIALTSKENDVISALRIIEPNLSGIKFVEQDRRSRGRTAQANIDGEIVPFKSMGDGINRILYIVLSMVNAQDGYLLIDEFENGLHYSVQEKVWKIIFSLAESLNVQVFATTHSSDCIEAFGLHWYDNKDKATMHRIDYKNKEHSVMPYNFSNLNNALITNTEVR
jgi:AAA15 family ATPase/GTPase